MATRTPAMAAMGQMHQKRPRHVEVCTKAAARNGPIAFPAPTQDPRIP